MGRGVKFGVNDVYTCRPDIAICMERYNKIMGDVVGNNPKEVSVSGKFDIYCMCEKKHIYHKVANKLSKYKCDKDGKIICPICSGKQIVKGINSLGDLRKDMLKEWDWTRNNSLNINPYEISPTSNKEVWWKCSKGHYWKASPNSRINNKDKSKIYGCRFCDKQEMWQGETDALTVLNNMGREDVIKEFYYADNGNLKLENLFYNGTKKYKFKCLKCGTVREKTFIQAVKHRCIGCTGQKPTKENNLKVNYPEIAEKYDKAGVNLIPSDKIISGGSQKYGFYCDVCKSVYFDTLPHQIEGRGCTNCYKLRRTSWPEQMIYIGLTFLMPEYKIENNFKVDGFSFDIKIEGLKLFIEYDGEYWHRIKRKEKRDIEYNQYVEKENYTILRVKENQNIEKFEVEDKSNRMILWVKAKNRDVDYMIEIIGAIIKIISKKYHINIRETLSLKEIEYIYSEANKRALFDLKSESLMAKNSNFVKELWDFDKNSRLNIGPNQVRSYSHMKVYWKDNTYGRIDIKLKNYLK